eukprot:jgi/Pico_ML_1/52619/g3298.t1
MLGFIPSLGGGGRVDRNGTGGGEERTGLEFHVDSCRMKRRNADAPTPFPTRKRREEPLRNATVDVMRGPIEERVLHGSLFAAFAGATAIPTRFDDANAYANAFAPLLVEEARQGIRNGFEEACSSRRWIHARVLAVEQAAKETRIRCCILKPTRRASKEDALGHVVVLCKAPPPVQDAVQWAKSEAAHVAVAFVSQRDDMAASNDADGKEIWLRWPHRNRFEAKQAMEAAVPGQETWLVKCGNLVVASRERDALTKCSTMPLLPALLQPKPNASKTMQLENMPWTAEFVQHLQHAFNPPQLEAIMSACARDPNAPITLVQDVLLERVMKRGCVDGRRTVYYPQVVRVGSTDAPLSKAARDVLLENRVASYMALSKVKVEGEEMHIAGELHKHMEKFETELSRMQIVKNFLRGGSQEKKAIMDLEISIVGEAEMVFATLSSCVKKPSAVLVLTPYRAQKEFLLEKFEKLLGQEAIGNLVKIETP